MRIGLFCRNHPARRRGLMRAGRLGALAGVWLLALVALFLAAGTGQARAAAAIPAAGGSLAFTAPVVDGVIGGPPGTKVTIQGAGWTAFGSVSLSLSSVAKDCTNVSPIGTYGTDASGAFSFTFVWPDTMNQIGTYYLCGTQFSGTTENTSYSDNTFTVLASSPASVSFSTDSVAPGGTVTLIGSNWLPGPQTINLVLVPCNIGCTQPQVGKVTVQSGKDGTFSQEVTISSKASLGSYYVQATNTGGTLTASAGPIQVESAVSLTETPPPGTTVTSVPATNTPQSGTTVTPTSDNKTALKYGLVAGGLGLVVLLVLVGGVALFISRVRGGADLSRFGRANEQRTFADEWSDEADQYPRRGYADAPGGPQRRQETPSAPAGRPKAQSFDADNVSKRAGAASSAGASSGELYPWQRPRSAPFGLPSVSEREEPLDEDEETPPRAPDMPSRQPPQDRPGGE